MTRPRVAITTGDPAGIGPEIAARAASDPRVLDACEPSLYGPPDSASFDPGLLSAAAGRAAYESIVRAVDDARTGQVDAIATAPVNKEAFRLAGLTGAPDVAMMFYSDVVRVVLATVHIPLSEVPRALTLESLERTIALTARELPRFGIARPRIAVAGLNPHAGEHGLFGRGEEEKKIGPAIESLRQRGIGVEGPLPADTLFFRAGRGDFDLVVAMYHDQGHGPVKVLGLEAGVNVTVGLPFVRTSVDHGTAFDIAGTGQADERSMVEALRQAVALAPKA